MDDSSLASSTLYRQAINAALESRWDEALTLNLEIIKSEPQNVDALNRLGKAYMELGNNSEAKKYYTQALEYDSYNPIASKNLKIIESCKENGQLLPHHGNGLANGQKKLSPSVFLQEPGKTKVVNLLKVAEPAKLLQAYCGMSVALIMKNRKLAVVDDQGSYLGVLPDDVSHNLLRLIKGGNKYEVLIKSIKVNGLSVMIRETFRSKRFKNQPSFLESHFESSRSADILTALDNSDDDEEEVIEEEPEV